jgi:UDP-glucose 4-epimerase
VHTAADIRSPEARRALEEVDVLYHLGFSLWRNDPAMAETNIDGGRNLLAANPTRVVLASSAAVYGAWPDNPLPLTESVTPRPNAECQYAVHKLRVEQMCADAAPTMSLRIGAVLGPHADARVRRSARGYRVAVPVIKGGHEAVQFVHEDDATDALHRAIATRAEGPVNVAPGDWLDGQGIAAVSGGRVLRLPKALLIRASEALATARLTPFGADRAILLNGPLALDPSKAGEVLGWKASRTSAEVLHTALS